MVTFKDNHVLIPTKTPVYKPPKAPAPKKGLPYDPSVFTYSPGNTAPGVPRAPAAATAPPLASSTAGDTGAALPPDATYEQIIAALQRKRDSTVTGLAGQRTTTLLNYGYTEDPAGKLAYDANNPESQAAQLKKHYDQSRSGTGITMAAQGQLYAGSYQNAQDNLNKGQLTDEDKMQKALQAYLAGNTSATAGAKTDYDLAAGQAYGDRVARAPQNPLYSPQGDQAGAPDAAPTLQGFGGQSIPDGTYSAKSAPAGLTNTGVKIPAGYVVVVKGGKVVDLRKQR